MKCPKPKCHLKICKYSLERKNKRKARKGEKHALVKLNMNKS
jgi:hypothetical protein